MTPQKRNKPLRYFQNFLKVPRCPSSITVEPGILSGMLAYITFIGNPALSTWKQCIGFDPVGPMQVLSWLVR